MAAAMAAAREAAETETRAEAAFEEARTAAVPGAAAARVVVVSGPVVLVVMVVSGTAALVAAALGAQEAAVCWAVGLVAAEGMGPGESVGRAGMADSPRRCLQLFGSRKQRNPSASIRTCGTPQCNPYPAQHKR